MPQLPQETGHVCIITRENLARFLNRRFHHKICTVALRAGSNMSRTRLPNRLLDLWKSNRPAITGKRAFRRQISDSCPCF